MGLIACPACGREVSSQANACPGCAHPVQAEKQKKGCLTFFLDGGLGCLTCGPALLIAAGLGLVALIRGAT